MTSQELLRKQFFNSILNLATTDGINASGKEEIYGCIFGRDSAITILKILRVLSTSSSLLPEEKSQLLTICKNALITLTTLQGTKTNIESGEEPGKFIHEYRKERYDHLLKLEKPWYVYPDGIMRIYDSLDSTPLALIAIFRYWELTRDGEFLLTTLPSVEKGLNWIISYGDLDKDFLLEYELKKERTYGGLPVQSWTDSEQSMLTREGRLPEYPIAPVEVQGYAWLALKLWGNYYCHDKGNYQKTKRFAKKLYQRADNLKQAFNSSFLLQDQGYYFAAQALDGYKRQIPTITGNPLLLLWASYTNFGKTECIVEEKYVEHFVRRAFCEDMFDSYAGIRTMSMLSPTFDPTDNSYHNGSFWPKLNGMTHEGLIHWGFTREASLLKTASIKPFEFFKSPIELYIKTEEGTYVEWKNRETGQTSCREQAWSAAAGFDLLSC